MEATLGTEGSYLCERSYCTPLDSKRQTQQPSPAGSDLKKRKKGRLMGKLKLKSVKKKKASPPVQQGRESLPELRKTLGFPEDTKFLGYAIYSEGAGEFLEKYSDSAKEGEGRKKWTKTPRSAICFMTPEQAFALSGKCPHSVVVGLFDTGSQIMTITMSVNR